MCQIASYMACTKNIYEITPMSFNTPIDRRKTYSTKWHYMESHFGVPKEDGLAMWTADSDYPTAPCVSAAVRDEANFGVFGYMPEYADYLQSVSWWMKNRHDWDVDPDWILSCQGLGNGIAMAIQTWSEEGRPVVER